MNDVKNCNAENAQTKDFSELGTDLVETFLKLGMTEDDLRAFIYKEKGMEDEAIAFEFRIPSTNVKRRLYEVYKKFHLIFKAVDNSEKEFLVTLPSTLVKWMDEEIESRGYESRDDLIRWVMHYHYQELRYGINIEHNDPLYQL